MSKSMPANWKARNKAKNFYKLNRFGTRKIDMEKLKELSMESRASAWSVKRLVNYVRSSGLSTPTVEKQDKFRWHPGMLLPDARMQIRCVPIHSEFIFVI